jgi:TonB family protein
MTRTAHRLLLVGLFACTEPAVAQTVAAPPPPPPPAWVNVSPRAYPAEALANRPEGEVRVEIAIGADHEVRECKVVAALDPVLDAASCKLLRERGWPGSALSYAASSPRQVRMRWRVPPGAPADAFTEFGGASPVSPNSWLTNDDYPVAALRAGEQGWVGIAFDISARGTAGGCTVIETSGSARLDADTCTLFMRRARFLPAADSDGKPIATRGKTRYRWLIPED